MSRYRRFSTVLLLACWALLSASTQAQTTITGIASGISDGDTFYLKSDAGSQRIRLAKIDAPEHAQPFGRVSEKSLRDLIWKQTVQVTYTQKDRYGRLIGMVRVDGLDVNGEQVRRGLAWVYRQYSKDTQLIEYESEAKKARLGLWADPAPIEPWAWRKAHRTSEE